MSAKFFAINFIIIFRRKDTNSLRAIHPNETNHSTPNLPKRNRRGGACVPARTSAQRRFHTQMDEYNYTHIGGGNASRTPAPIT